MKGGLLLAERLACASLHRPCPLPRSLASSSQLAARSSVQLQNTNTQRRIRKRLRPRSIALQPKRSRRSLRHRPPLTPSMLSRRTGAASFRDDRAIGTLAGCSKKTRPCYIHTTWTATDLWLIALCCVTEHVRRPSDHVETPTAHVQANSCPVLPDRPTLARRLEHPDRMSQSFR